MKTIKRRVIQLRLGQPRMAVNLLFINMLVPQQLAQVKGLGHIQQGQLLLQLLLHLQYHMQQELKSLKHSIQMLQQVLQ